MLLCIVVQGPGSSEQVAALQAEIKIIKKSNQDLLEDNKVPASG